MAVEEPFDLYQIFINEITGDLILAIALGMFLIFYIGIKQKMSWPVIFLLEVVFVSIMFAETFNIVLWVFVLLAVGTLFYFVISKLIKR